MSMSHICRATCKTPKNLDVVGVHVVGIRQCSAFALHLACIRSRCSAVADQKKRSFSTMASFFFIIGNCFQRFVGQTFITSISFKYTVCGKKGRKKISPPVREIAPPGFQVLATGLPQCHPSIFAFSSVCLFCLCSTFLFLCPCP